MTLDDGKERYISIEHAAIAAIDRDDLEIGRSHHASRTHINRDEAVYDSWKNVVIDVTHKVAVAFGSHMM